MVSGSPERLARLVANLVDNAVKWSPPGAGVEVALASGELSVRDHGPGIAPADLPLVFDRFYRSPAARSLPGSGLGLAIVRQVAEAHGALVTAENAGGGGACGRESFAGESVGPILQPTIATGTASASEMAAITTCTATNDALRSSPAMFTRRVIQTKAVQAAAASSSQPRTCRRSAEEPPDELDDPGDHVDGEDGAEVDHDREHRHHDEAAAPFHARFWPPSPSSSP